MEPFYGKIISCYHSQLMSNQNSIKTLCISVFHNNLLKMEYNHCILKAGTLWELFGELKNRQVFT